jgi:hypothetical protein
MIALTASHYDVPLWSHDKDFKLIQKEIPLQLYVAPQIELAQWKKELAFCLGKKAPIARANSFAKPF